MPSVCHRWDECDNKYDIELYFFVSTMCSMRDRIVLLNMSPLWDLRNMCALWPLPDVRCVSPFVSALVLFFFFSFRGKGRNN